MKNHLNKSTDWTPQGQKKPSPFGPRPFTNEQVPDTQPTQAENVAEEQPLGPGWDLTKKLAQGSLSSEPPPMAFKGIPGQPLVQAKLKVGAADDKYEQEADRVAARVVDQIHSAGAGQPLVQSDEQISRKPEMKRVSGVQRSLLAGGEASSEIESAINRSRGSGQPLDAGLRESMGQAMGADFSQVRVHTGAQADGLNQSIQAKAFTTGQDVFFRQGEYRPESRSGQELIAHELTHVVQQSGQFVQHYGKPLLRRRGITAIQLKWDFASEFTYPEPTEEEHKPEPIERNCYINDETLEVYYPDTQELGSINSTETRKLQEQEAQKILEAIERDQQPSPIIATLSSEFEASDSPEGKDKQENTDVKYLLRQLGLLGEDVEESIFNVIDKTKFPDNWEHVEQQYLHYCKLMQSALEGLESGFFGVRWLTMSLEQKLEVARRMALSLMVVGELVIQSDMDYDSEEDTLSDYFDEDYDQIAMVHGSFLWGERGHTPGDLDLMVLQEAVELEKNYEPDVGFGTQSVPRNVTGDITVGQKFCGTLDHILNIALVGKIPNLNESHPVELWNVVQKDLWKLIQTANVELQGKQYGNNKKDNWSAGRRKVVNCAVALNYFCVQLFNKDHPKLLEIIHEANIKLLQGELSGNNSYLSLFQGVFFELADKATTQKAPKQKIKLSEDLIELLDLVEKNKLDVQQFLNKVAQMKLVSELELLEKIKSDIQEMYPNFATLYWQ